jgi:hypothetical protein
MVLRHCDIFEILPDEWWQAAGMVNFERRSESYRCLPTPGMFLMSPEEIEPVKRGVGIFHSGGDDDLPAIERTTRILRAMREEVLLPPIVVHGSRFYAPSGRRRLYDGTHRLYCTIACQFPFVPVIETSEPPAEFGITHIALPSCPGCSEQLLVYSGERGVIQRERTCPSCQREISEPPTVVVVQRFQP